MKKLKNILFLLFVAASLYSQIHIFGLRVYANEDEYQPPIIALESGVLTIEFDVDTQFPPNLNIQFEHVDRTWQSEKNILIQDEVKSLATFLGYTAAANGVQNYTYHFRNSFPNRKNTVQFLYSGNYVFRILDISSNNAVLAEGKFIVVEKSISTSMEIENINYPSLSAPWNKRLAIHVDVSASPEYMAADNNTFISQQIKHVDIIENWKITNPYSIDLDVRNFDTFVENFMNPQKQFWIRSISPGNEYRRLDLSDVTKYPNGNIVRLVDGVDVSRVLWQGKPDANGAAKLNPFTGANSDYLEVLMRLTLPSKPVENIYLVGAFNQWQPSEKYRMIYDSTISQYQRRITVKRGVYDYQYITADYDSRSNTYSNENWIELEGNDWRTINRYTALVYYHDERLGGYDRIIGSASMKNSGNNKAHPVNLPKDIIQPIIR